MPRALQPTFIVKASNDTRAAPGTVVTLAEIEAWLDHRTVNLGELSEDTAFSQLVDDLKVLERSIVEMRTRVIALGIEDLVQQERDCLKQGKRSTLSAGLRNLIDRTFRVRHQTDANFQRLIQKRADGEAAKEEDDRPEVAQEKGSADGTPPDDGAPRTM